MASKIIVTGSAGFIGSHTAAALLAAGHEVLGIDNLDPYYSLRLKQHNLDQLTRSPNFQFGQVDIREPEQLALMFQEFAPETVIHLAAKAGVRQSLVEPQNYFAVNVQGTLNVLEAARQAGAQKVLAASSSSVYGDNQTIPFSESDHVPSQVSPYAASKRAMEVLCKSYAEIYHLPIQMFRFFTVYGPSGRPDMAVALFTEAITSGQPLSIFGDTSSERDYTYIDDIVAGLLGALPREELFAIYNLGNNHPHSLEELIQAIEKASKQSARRQITPRQPGDVLRTWANIEKAQTSLGYQPKTTLTAGIKKFVQWYIKHRELYSDE